MQAVRNHNRHFIAGIGIVDETSCGPLCQHPACWRSNERVEKGLPNVVKSPIPHQDNSDDLPTLNVYNLLDDYGFISKDRFSVAKQTPHKPVHPAESMQVACCPANSPSMSRLRPIKSASAEKTEQPVPVKQVEVQEVFDLEDLSNTWDKTFLAKQYYVWVPNPNWKKPPKSNNENECPKPGPIPPKDLTEELVPRSIEVAREAAITKRSSQHRSRSPYRFYSPTPWPSAREEIDMEGINELLDLPREILLKVLDHCHPSDLKSKEKLHQIIYRFMPHYEPISEEMDHANDDVLRQSKVPLHDGRLKNLRQPTLLASGPPVFRLDDDRHMIGVTPMNSAVDFQQTESPRADNKVFSKQKPPLPAIGSKAASMENIKVSSVSLGLPELPSGVRTTRPFNYRNLDLDFTLGPSVPLTDRSTVPSQSAGSDHGTSLQVNVPLPPSERQDIQTLPEVRAESPNSVPEHPAAMAFSEYICPTTPVGTPMSAPGLVQTNTRGSSHKRESTTDSQEKVPSVPSINMRNPSKAPKSPPFRTNRDQTKTDPRNSPKSSAAVLGKISESSGSENGEVKKAASLRRDVALHRDIPPQPPSSPQSGHGELSSLSPVPTVTHVIMTNADGTKELNAVTPGATQGEPEVELQQKVSETITERTNSPSSSVDAWPTDIVEKSFDVSRTATQQSTHIPMTPDTLDSTAVGFDMRSEKSRVTSVQQSEVRSPISDNSTVKRKSAGKSSESPGPPPPSPEPKDGLRTMAKNPDRYSSKSRDSLSMAPVFEEQESEDETSISADPPSALIDSQHFPALVLDPENTAIGTGDEAPQTVSAFVDIEKVAGNEMDLNEDFTDPCQEMLEHLEDNQATSPDSSDRQASRLALELDRDSCPSRPPECDGRSSTYLTERDRRYTPEGIESPVGVDVGNSTFREDINDTETPREGNDVNGLNDHTLDKNQNALSAGQEFISETRQLNDTDIPKDVFSENIEDEDQNDILDAFANMDVTEDVSFVNGDEKVLTEDGEIADENGDVSEKEEESDAGGCIDTDDEEADIFAEESEDEISFTLHAEQNDDDDDDKESTNTPVNEDLGITQSPGIKGHNSLQGPARFEETKIESGFPSSTTAGIMTAEGEVDAQEGTSRAGSAQTPVEIDNRQRSNEENNDHLVCSQNSQGEDIDSSQPPAQGVDGGNSPQRISATENLDDTLSREPPSYIN